VKGKKEETQLCVVSPRDRALIGLMVYSFARIGAVLQMQVCDYYPNGKR
jgi:integrase/recombinase XerD